MVRLTPADLEVPAALIAGLVELVRATVRAEAKSSQEGDGDPWVAIDAHLGVTRREAAELARAGHIKGALKLNKRWRARRSECDAAIERIGVAPPAPVQAPAANDDESALLEELGLEAVEAPKRRAAR